MKIPIYLKTITPLLWRVIVFLGLFIVITGLVGLRIISGGILFRDGFALYGGLGKALIFSLTALILIMRRGTSSVKLQPWQPILLTWFAGAAIALGIGWMNIESLLRGQREVSTLLIAHGGLLLSVLLVAVGCIGPGNLRALWRHHRSAITNSLALGMAFYLFLLLIYGLWESLASLVLYSVNGLLNLSGLHTLIAPPHTLVFDKFAVTIAEYCSGIESIALFTGLYAIVGLLDWDRLRKGRYFTLFPFALILLFLLNIVRVYALILAGYYINPQIAFTLFHTYAGLIFFVLYSAIFWAVAYKYMIKRGKTREREHRART